MSIKLTTEQFVKNAKEKHGNIYDYSKTEYINSQTKVEIICKKHGSFWQTPKHHAQRGQGCPSCNSAQPLNTELFVEKAREKHKDKYDYSKSKCLSSNDKVLIICKKHGEFKQRVGDHLFGHGCKKCGIESSALARQDNKVSVVGKFKKIHGDRYNYSNVDYNLSQDLVEIICKKHGSFWQKPNNHLCGEGCPECGFLESIKTRTKTKASFIEDAINVHNYLYDYSNIQYINSDTKVEIICKKHGSFWQTPGHHLNNHGCPSCKNDWQQHELGQVLEDFNEVHNHLYDYSKVNYVHGKSKVEIICRKHGSFWQTPMSHKFGRGCAKCAKVISKPEVEIGDFLESLGIVVERNVRGLFSDLNFEADLFLPERKIVIEYDGLIWHSEKFAKNLYNVLDKTKMVNSAGYRCIHIREDYYLDNPNKIKSLLKSALGLFDNKIGARQTIKKDISGIEYKKLCEDHLQGYRPAKVKKGLFYKGVLVAAIGYNDSGELIRYIVKNGWLIQGALPKLLKNEIVTFSFCDLSFFTGQSYPKAGFSLDYVTEPNYIYVKGSMIRSRQQMMKHKLSKVLDFFDEGLTEVENCNLNNWYRLFDAGNAKYVIK